LLEYTELEHVRQTAYIQIVCVRQIIVCVYNQIRAGPGITVVVYLIHSLVI
jgi:hypothetical protein